MPHRFAASLFRARPVLSLVVILSLMAASTAVAWWHGAGIERVQLDLAEPERDRSIEVESEDDEDEGEFAEMVLAGSVVGVRTYLLVGVGSAGLDIDEARELGITDADERGDDLATDTMMLLVTHQPSGQAALLSLPRDTWLEHRRGRLNAVYATGGDSELVTEVERLTGVPVHHLVRVNFGGFAAVVEAAGGVQMEIDRPLRDDNAKLLIEEAGCYLMGPRTALAYVRSRSTLTLNEFGQWVTDDEATDFGRQAKQRRFLTAAWDNLRGPQLLRAIPGLVRAAGDNVALDSGLGLAEVAALASAFQGVGSSEVEQHQLPGRIGNAGRLSVVFIDEVAAEPMLDRLRNWPPPVDEDVPSEVAPSEGDEGGAADADRSEADEGAASGSPAAPQSLCEAGPVTELP